MNGNPMLGQVLGGLFGQAMGRRGMGGMGGMGGLGGGLGGMGGLGGGLGGIALGSVLGGMLGGRRGGMGMGVGRGGMNQTALLMMLLPLAMRWVQSQGGMNAVMDKFRQKGMHRQAQSWMSTGENEPIDEQAVEQVVGSEELRQMAQRLGVPEQQVAQGFAEIMPEMVDKMTPQGQMPDGADEVLDESTRALEKEIQDVEYRDTTRH
ncbi:MAG TPA: YidB family protein [Ramlibacter sp.]|jgi:uncharacterized protein YidB (DUF937 family)|nr:YidB family protein [Ramlibacter sp.]